MCPLHEYKIKPILLEIMLASIFNTKCWLYKVWCILNSCELNSLLPLIYWGWDTSAYFLIEKSRVWTVHLLTILTFRASNLHKGLSSKDKAGFIISRESFTLQLWLPVICCCYLLLLTVSPVICWWKGRKTPCHLSKSMRSMRQVLAHDLKMQSLAPPPFFFIKEPYCWAECLKSHFNHIL